MEQKVWTFAGAVAFPLLFTVGFLLGSILRFTNRILSFLWASKRGGHSQRVMVSRLDELDEYLLVEILSRLPVRTLFQLKSVSRRWNAIISSPYLLSMHLKNHTNGPAGDASQTLMVDGNDNSSPQQILQLDPDGDVSQVRCLGSRMGHLTGPCNGIFMLYKYDRVCLWNPATGASRIIPLPTTPNPEDVYDSYGFGLYNSVADDFKIILIRQVSEFDNWPHYPIEPPQTGRWSSPEFPSEVLVYTLGTNTWRKLEDLRHQLEIVRFTENYTYLNGFYFWLCASPVAALAFDFRNDVFRVINDPIPITFHGRFDKALKRIFVYEDSLALCIRQGGSSGGGGGYDMWLLSEQWCWIKHLAIGPFIPKDLIPVGCWRNNQIIVRTEDQTELGTDTHLLLFDPATQATKVLVPDFPCIGGVFSYRESLVNVSGNEVG